MKNLHKTWFDYFLVVLFLFLLVITLYPFLNVLAISLNDATDTIKNVSFIFPRKFTLTNYKYVFEEGGVLQPLFMSIAKTVIGTAAGVICTAMLAYTLSRRDFVFHKVFTLLFVITMYVGGGMIPEYLLIMRTLKLGNNFLVYIIPGLIWVYNMILVRSFIDGLPPALRQRFPELVQGGDAPVHAGHRHHRPVLRRGPVELLHGYLSVRKGIAHPAV